MTVLAASLLYLSVVYRDEMKFMRFGSLSSKHLYPLIYLTGHRIHPLITAVSKLGGKGNLVLEKGD